MKGGKRETEGKEAIFRERKAVIHQWRVEKDDVFPYGLSTEQNRGSGALLDPTSTSVLVLFHCFPPLFYFFPLLTLIDLGINNDLCGCV